MITESEKFPGFPSDIKKKFWMFPRILDMFWYQLTPPENTILTFILRRTVGFQKVSDKISLTQFEKGLGRYDRGTGLSRKQVIKSIKGLEKKGFITVVRGGNINNYSLVLSEHQVSTQLNTNSSTQEILKPSVEVTHTIDNVPIEKAIERIYKFYSRIIRPGQRLTREANMRIRERFGEYHPKEIIRAMRNARENDYWGEVVVKQTIAWFFGSEERIATFLALGTNDESLESKEET